MSINVLEIIIIVFLAMGIIQGFKRGLIEGVMSLLTSLLGIVVLVVLAKGVGNFIQGSYINVLMALILLIIINIFHKIGRFLLDSFKLVGRLPVIHSLDKIAGVFLGLAESVVFIWLIFILAGVFHPFEIHQWITAQVYESTLLTMLYKTNGLILLLQYL